MKWYCCISKIPYKMEIMFPQTPNKVATASRPILLTESVISILLQLWLWHGKPKLYCMSGTVDTSNLWLGRGKKVALRRKWFWLFFPREMFIVRRFIIKMFSRERFLDRHWYDILSDVRSALWRLFENKNPCTSLLELFWKTKVCCICIGMIA